MLQFSYTDIYGTESKTSQDDGHQTIITQTLQVISGKQHGGYEDRENTPPPKS